MSYNPETRHLSGTQRIMADKRLDSIKKEKELERKSALGIKENPLIEEHNKKVVELNNIIKWFEEEYQGIKELSEIIQGLKGSAIQIQEFKLKK